MDFGGLLVLGVVWLLFNLLGRGRGPTAGPRSTSRPHQGGLPGSAGGHPTVDATQREGSRLEQLLRHLEQGLEQAESTQARTRLPLPPLPDDEDVEDRRSLDQEPVRVVSLETEVKRPPRVVYDQDSGAEALVLRRIAAADARSGPLTKAGHRAFDDRIRQEPADHTATPRYTPAQLRSAIVWREILGPPVSERDR